MLMTLMNQNTPSDRPGNFNLYSEHRVWELDFIRGICILLMLFDHTLFDLNYIFKINSPLVHFYFDWILRDLVWAVVVLSFVLVSGISCSFSKSNLARALKLLAVALALSIVTKGMDLYIGSGNKYFVAFGVLHMFALSILLFSLLDWVLAKKAEEKQKRKLLLYMGLILVIIGFVFMFHKWNAPENANWLAAIVYLKKDFFSADYFPLLPYAGVLLLGGYMGPILYPKKKSRKALKGPPKKIRPVLFTGRHALIFYLLHQPLITGILYILFFFLRR